MHENLIIISYLSLTAIHAKACPSLNAWHNKAVAVTFTVMAAAARDIAHLLIYCLGGGLMLLIKFFWQILCISY